MVARMTRKEPPKFRYAGLDEIALVQCETVIDLFRKGLDTAEIARRFKSRSEASIYNALAHAREAERSAR